MNLVARGESRNPRANSTSTTNANLNHRSHTRLRTIGHQFSAREIDEPSVRRGLLGAWSAGRLREETRGGQGFRKHKTQRPRSKKNEPGDPWFDRASR